MSVVEPAGMLFSAGGDVLDRRYELIAPIGVGAMAEVFRARDLLLDRDVAVKVFHRHLLRDPLTLARARSEMLVLARLGDAHLVRLYDASFPDPPGQPYLVMELVDGGTLTDAVGRAPMSTHRTAEVGTRLAQALAHVHAAGVVHRDVKPANVLLTPDGDVKLADFGIALADGSRVTATRTVVGTAGYLAPEQIRGADAGPCADVHALGLILLECLTARREYPGSDVQAAVARLHRAPVIPADLPRAWRRLLAELTADEPAARPTAAAAHRHLAELSGDWGLDVVPVAETRSAAVRARAVVAAAVVVVAGLGGLMTLGRTGDRPPAPVTVDSVAGAGAGAGLAGSGTSVTSRGVTPPAAVDRSGSEDVDVAPARVTTVVLSPPAVRVAPRAAKPVRPGVPAGSGVPAGPGVPAGSGVPAERVGPPDVGPLDAPSPRGAGAAPEPRPVPVRDEPVTPAWPVIPPPGPTAPPSIGVPPTEPAGGPIPAPATSPGKPPPEAGKDRDRRPPKPPRAPKPPKKRGGAADTGQPSDAT